MIFILLNVVCNNRNTKTQHNSDKDLTLDTNIHGVTCTDVMGGIDCRNTRQHISRNHGKLVHWKYNDICQHQVPCGIQISAVGQCYIDLFYSMLIIINKPLKFLVCLLILMPGADMRSKLPLKRMKIASRPPLAHLNIKTAMGSQISLTIATSKILQ